MSRILINHKKGAVLAEEVLFAKTTKERMKGLLGHTSLPENTAMLIEPCRSIHMWFMKFPIDAVFLDQDMNVIKIRKELKPWQIALAPRKTYAVLECAANSTNQLTMNDQLFFT